MNVPQISAVIPVGNFHQDNGNISQMMKQLDKDIFEVILVLDNQTLEDYRLAELMLQASGLRGKVLIVNCKNPGGARNAGIQNSQSEWLVFWDSDDTCYPENLISLVNGAIASNSQLAIGGFCIEHSLGEVTNQFPIDIEKWRLQVGVNPGLWRMAFNRTLITGIEFPELSMGEDQVFLSRAEMKNPKTYVADHLVYKYRVGVANQLTSNQARIKDLVIAHKLMLQINSSLPHKSVLVRCMIIRQTLSIIKHGMSDPAFVFFGCVRTARFIITSPSILRSIPLIIPKQ